MEVKNHLLYDNGVAVVYRQTPNLSSGVLNPKFIAIHFDAASNSTSAVNWLTDKSSEVSAHLHVTKACKITQLAKFNSIAWHVGKSEYKGLKQLNKYAIGIEIENRGKVGKEYEDYQKCQIDTVVEICKAIVKAYPSIKEIVGHDMVAMPRGRKDDPGPKFPLAEVNKRVFGETIQSVSATKTTTTGVNLRPSAGTNNTPIQVLTKGTEVHVLSEQGGWSEVLVCSNNKKGWIFSQYLK